MELIRLIRKDDYWDNNLGRFQSFAFSNSSKGGISVIDKDCILASGRNVCDHIRTFYAKSLTGSPPVYWEFDRELLPDKCHLEQKTTESGDYCHHNIHGLSDNKAGKLLKNNWENSCYKCYGNDAPIPFDA
jgi:hypothetical protein